MIYISNTFNLEMLETIETNQKINITILSESEMINIIKKNNEISSNLLESNIIKLFSNDIDINKIESVDTIRITPEDILIVIKKLNGCKIEFLRIVISGNWKVDYYCNRRKLLKNIDLGNINYDEARNKAFINGINVPYEVCDLYYVKK